MKNNLKYIKSFAIYGFLLAVLFSCSKHDFLDEHLITGNIGPQAYWETSSSTVRAGGRMNFNIQYYTTSKIDFSHSEVWYNLNEVVEKSVSCPWVISFNYSVNSITSNERRISQRIESYPHTLAVWSDSLRAYQFNASFPVSGTLSPFTWIKPEVFDSTKMKTYFGDNFMQQFKDSLYGLMKFQDFRNMILGMSLLETFKEYTDSTFDANSNEYVYHFPKKLNGETPVPVEIKNLYDNIGFDKLIESPGAYNVEYKRSYNIDANMRVYDKQNVYGSTILKKIDIN